MRRTNLLRYGLLAFGLMLVIGCSSDEDRPETIPVSGTVMYNGKPVKGATVTFRNPDASRPASGVTDSKGKFKLTTFEADDGALPGKCVVTIEKVKPGTQPAANMEDNPPDTLTQANMSRNQQKKSRQSGPKSLLPTRYADPKRTPFKETVSEGVKPFLFQLKD